MPLRSWLTRSEAVPGAPGLRALTVSADQWRSIAQDLAAAAHRLVALWASADPRGGPTLRAVFVGTADGFVLSVPLVHCESPYPGVERPVSGRRAHAARDPRSDRT